MKIAAIYARVSSARQQQNENIGSQLGALLAYAKTHDYQVSPHHVFQDDGHSGAYLDRPALERLRDSVAAGELEAVLIVALGGGESSGLRRTDHDQTHDPDLRCRIATSPTFVGKPPLSS